MTRYDDLYASTPHALGEPTPAVAALWKMLPEGPLTLLDVGCGQGRDALPLARLGHHVTGFDPSPAGIAQLQADAAAQDLPITAVVADAAGFESDDQFDVLLIDRTLHMILDDTARGAALAHLLQFLAPQGWVLIADEPSNMEGLRAVLHAHGAWDVRHDSRSQLLWRALD